MGKGLRRFSIRQKLWTGGGIFLLLFSVLGGYVSYALLTIDDVLTALVAHDEPVLRHTLSLQAKLKSSSTALGLFLVERSDKHITTYQQSLAQAKEHLAALLDLNGHQRGAADQAALQEIQSLLDELGKAYADVIAVNQEDSLNVMALAYAIEHFNPTSRTILEELNALSHLPIETDDNSQARQLAGTVADLRFTWSRLVAELRAYLANRNPALMNNARDYLLQSNQLTRSLLDNLDLLPFEYQAAIESLPDRQAALEKDLNRIEELHGSRYWRKDIKIVAERIDPMHTALDAIVARLVDHARQHISDEGAAGLSISSSAISLTGILVAAVLASGSLLLILIIRAITQPIMEAVTAMDDIAGGSGNLNRQLDDHGRDEIAQLARGFNAFVSKIKSVVDLVIVSSTSLAEESGRMHQTTARSKEQVAAQQLHIGEIGEVINDMAHAADQVSSRAHSAADNARGSEQHAAVGRETVSAVLDGVRSLADEVGSSTLAISQVEKNSDRIGGVLSVIRGFSEQTNLLALNAAIEAARAGEHGRGFAVVADEVRSLSEKIHQETDSIESIISELQRDTHGAVRRMQDSTEHTRRLVDQADQADQALTAITDSVTAIAQANDDIAHLTDTQQQQADAVRQRVVKLQAIAGQSADSANQASSSANEFTIMAGQLQDLVQQFLLEDRHDDRGITDPQPVRATPISTEGGDLPGTAADDDVTLF